MTSDLFRFDWFAEIDATYERVRTLINDIDAQIIDMNDTINVVKKQKPLPEKNIRDLNETKKELKRKREKTWENCCSLLPRHFYSQWKVLSLLSNQKPIASNLADLATSKYVDLLSAKGRKIIDDGLSFAEIDGLYNLFDAPVIESFDNLPPYSLFVQFTFKLATPYLSKDNDEFYMYDNPISKDKVFKVPIVSASTWKGNLRWVARQCEGLNPERPDTSEITRLFGNEKGQEERFRKGRLNFYTTFFNEIGLEVINPHDRKTKAGTVPIFLESVPTGATGTFTMLYVPFDLLGKPDKEVTQQVADDMELAYYSLCKMMLTYGFSAKKSSGFGVIKDEFKRDGDPAGVIRIKGGTPEQETFASFTDLSDKIEQMLHAVGGES